MDNESPANESTETQTKMAPDSVATREGVMQKLERGGPDSHGPDGVDVQGHDGEGGDRIRPIVTHPLYECGAMAVPKKSVEAAYQRYARKYDLAVKLYRLIGLHIERYRSRAVELLRLKPGDCVVDLGCGTGLNFPLLIQNIGPEGRLIGVDFSSEMLARARKRVDRSGWKNVELIESDIAAYEFPGASTESCRPAFSDTLASVTELSKTYRMRSLRVDEWQSSMVNDQIDGRHGCSSCLCGCGVRLG